MIDAQVLPTPVGELSVLVRDGVLVAAGFTPEPKEMFARLAPAVQAEGLTVIDDLGPASRAVRDYFAGDLDALDAIPAEQPGSPLRRALHQALRQVKAGTTVTYAELAERAGLPRSAARAAGGACARNLIAPFVPCHRVLPSTGGFGGYYYGVAVKEWLLEHESSRR
ncbi:methylated-DNA--[protein]-cysteine S-methyltransferase [Nonomuraea sp. MCN248]|uniref:Methylated-DNA--[protein]-cysteine S-methyltransferase n=1 Tax=Nonomuraea corallina TaxID=2989783 RepID=A0ABT4SDN9_9ACTN|nr:methylated-DNA--[protein]-cysteine S-methyltransferase [Nonomuraea corallina]MDA0635299.1 methylated-DNA--[protein]-cysteine S-methyltransferase [Nonomuraea corallina]